MKRSQGPWDAADDLERQVRNHYRILVLLGRHVDHDERSLQLEEPKVRILEEKLQDGELQARCPCHRVQVGSGLVLLCRLSSGHGLRGLLSCRLD